MADKPNSLVINSPYDKPDQFWSQDDNGRVAGVVSGRRPAAYELYDSRNNTPRVRSWKRLTESVSVSMRGGRLAGQG